MPDDRLNRLRHEDWATLAQEFTAIMRAHAPGWTDVNVGDPGITLVELFTFLFSDLFATGIQLPESTRQKLLMAVEQLSRMRQFPCPPSGSFTRVRYFTGKLLTAEDLQAEQDYHRAKCRYHNLWHHGTGIVSGLHLTLDSPSTSSGQATVHVNPGVAIDGTGEELAVCEPLSATVPADMSSCFVTLSRIEVPIAPVPAVNSDLGAEASRIEERVQLEIVTGIPQNAVELAHLERHETGWRMDPDFHPLRSR
jgi:hypothetical protein